HRPAPPEHGGPPRVQRGADPEGMGDPGATAGDLAGAVGAAVRGCVRPGAADRDARHRAGDRDLRLGHSAGRRDEGRTARLAGPRSPPHTWAVWPWASSCDPGETPHV